MTEPTQPAPVFVLDPAPTVPWPVDVRVPVAGGDFAVQRFTATMRVLSEADYAALLDGAPAQPGADAPLEAKPAEPAAPKTDAEHLADNARLFPGLVAGWAGVQTPDGATVPFTPEALAALVIGPHGKAVSAGLWRAVSEIRHGVRLGNFAAPPVAG